MSDDQSLLGTEIKRPGGAGTGSCQSLAKSDL